MKIYGITSEVTFLRLWENGAKTKAECKAMVPLTDSEPLFTGLVAEQAQAVLMEIEYRDSGVQQLQDERRMA